MKLNVKGTGCEWSHLAQDKYWWMIRVERDFRKIRDFVANLATISFSMKFVL
jgi:hypothetical protein